VPAAAWDLLEREGELAQCGVLVDEACHGSGRLLLVEGSAGIGKTRLLAALCERARAAGMQVLCARGGELERDFPYGVARQLFEPTLARELEPEDLLAGAAALAAPLFRDSFLLSEPVASGAPSFATLHGLFWLAANLAARRPLALAVDDLHWADGPSLRWLAYLVRRLDGIAVLVAACHRPAEPGADERLLAEVLSEPTAFAVQPAPLSQAAIGRLIAETLAEEAEPSFRTACFEATGGNPFLAVQLLRALAREGVLPTAAQDRKSVV